jgi:hypothetical protein
MPSNSGDPYRVAVSRKTLDELSELGERAARLGIKQLFLDTLKTIDQKLKNEPATWGDPHYRLRHAGLHSCHGLYSVLHVYYAVDEAKRIFYVKEFQPLFWQRFESQ